MKNSHPREIIRVEVMEPLGLTIEDAAPRFEVPAGLLTDGLEWAAHSTVRF